MVRWLTWTKFRTGKIPHLPSKSEGKIPHQVEIRNFPRGKTPPRNSPPPPPLYVVYPGNTPANHPPTEACMIHSKQHRGCRIQDPGTCGKHQTEKKNPWCTGRGCRVQNAATGGGKPPTLRTPRAQRTVRRPSLGGPDWTVDFPLVQIAEGNYHHIQFNSLITPS